MASLIPKSFFTRTDVVQISKDLLGKHLVSNFEGQKTVGMIVETEAYRAPDDKGCHAYANKRTERTSTMFKEGGVAYVYVCYGIHHLFNVVTGPKGSAHAVLIRAIEPQEGLEFMERRRGTRASSSTLVNGPGKFTVAMGIDKSSNACSLLTRGSGLYLEDGKVEIHDKDIIAGPRVGMGRSVAECSNWPWRFRIKNNKWTSKPNIVHYDWA